MVSAWYRRRGESSIDSTDSETVMLAIVELFVNLVIRLSQQSRTYVRRNP